MPTKKNNHLLTKNILNNLPMGVELYNKEGELIEVNHIQMERIGIKEKKDIIGTNLFDNPNIPQEVKYRLLAGEDINCIINHDFDLVQDYFTTESPCVKYLEISASILYDEQGNVDNYMLTTNDITERILLNEELCRSKLKNDMIIRTFEAMPWEFDATTELFTCEKIFINKFNWHSPFTLQDCLSTVHPKDKAILIEMGNMMLQGEKPPPIKEVRMKFPTQKDWQFCAIKILPCKTKSDGKVIKYIGFIKNNTYFRKKEMLMGKILDSIPLSIQIKDVENNFRYVFCNKESTRMFGSLKNQTVNDIMDKKMSDKIHQIDYQVFSTGKTYFGHEKIILKDGRSYDTIVQKIVIEDNKKRLILNTYWDMSLQKELERKSKFFSISLNALNAYTWYYDIDRDILTCRDGVEKFGKQIDLWHNLDEFIKCIHPDDQEYVHNTMYGMCSKKNGEFVLEYRVNLEENNQFTWWECRGIIETIEEAGILHHHMYGMAINIEVRKKAELLLIENREKMAKLNLQNELVLNNVNSGLAYITKDFIVQWENISICGSYINFRQYKQGELCYKNAHKQNEPCKNCIVQKALATKHLEKTKFLQDNGKMIEVFATPVLNKNGDTEGVVLRLDDITEHQNMINELEKAKWKAEESDRLKSAFLANMSHEIRTPLNAIVGFSDLLMITTDPKEKEDYINIINTNNELLLKLINDILDLSKIESGAIDLNFVQFDLASFFNELYTLMQQRITNPHVVLLSTNPYSSCIVKMDKNRLAQIIINYVTNSIKYTAKGHIEMGYSITKGKLRVYVQDTGIGIPENKKHKVFQRFEKLDEFAQGTGLGLSICKAIAKACGGKVGFNSVVGQGTTFWVTLPCEVKKNTDTNPITH